MRITLAGEVPVFSVAELQRLYPGEHQEDLSRFLALARQRNLSRENTLWLLDFARCATGAIARLEATRPPAAGRAH